MLKFELLATDPTSHARRGTLTLNHGVVQTPIFMPVGTYGTVKGVMPRSLEDMGAQIILGNTFHLWMRPGQDVMKSFGGLHGFEQVECAGHVVAEVALGLGHRLPHLRECCKVHHCGERPAAERIAKSVGVQQISLDQRAPLHGPAVAGAEVIEGHGQIACMRKLLAHVRADVAGTAADQDRRCLQGRLDHRALCWVKSFPAAASAAPTT